MPLRANGKHAVDISGAMTFESAPALYLEARPLLTSQVSMVSLAEVTRIDSAGLALLLEWQADARARGSRLEFVDAPADLLRLAVLSESKSLLGLSARKATAAGQPDEHNGD